MRRPHLAVAFVSLTLALGAACSMSTLEKDYRKVTGKEDKNANLVELNTAGRKRLAKLPGLTEADADRIVSNRPYKNRKDLVRKGVLTEAQFEHLRNDVYVDHEKD